MQKTATFAAQKDKRNKSEGQVASKALRNGKWSVLLTGLIAYCLADFSAGCGGIGRHVRLRI